MARRKATDSVDALRDAALERIGEEPAEADAEARELASDAVGRLARADLDYGGAEAGDRREERVEVRARRHRDAAEALGERLEDREGRLPDGAGGSQQRHAAGGRHRGRSSGRR